MKKLLVVPVYNEAETIGAVFREIRCFYSGDILIVDDGSSDGSMEELSKIQCGHCRVLSHRQNLGYGASLIDGFNFAIGGDFDVVATMDCDAQHEPSYLPSLFSDIGDLDVLSGSRYLENLPDNTEAPDERRGINAEITEMINSRTNLKLTDSFCGFKAYRVDGLRRLKLTEPGYAFPLQFWVQAHFMELCVEEVAVPRIYTGANRSFGPELDKAETRRMHYMDVFEKEWQRWT